MFSPSTPPQDNPETASLIIMASGFSSRFGTQNKLTFSFLGKPLACYTLDFAASLPGYFIDRLFICAGPDVCTLAQGYRGITVIQNRRPERGPCESVRLGVELATGDYFLFLPCDQPFIDVATVNTLWKQREPGKIIVPVLDGRHKSPVLFSSSFRQEFLSLEDGQPPRLVKKRHPECVKEVLFDNSRPFADIDTLQDAQELAETQP